MFRVHLVRCPRCKFPVAVKNGHNKQGKQRYMCKWCKYQYISKRRANQNRPQAKSWLYRQLFACSVPALPYCFLYEQKLLHRKDRNRRSKIYELNKILRCCITCISNYPPLLSYIHINANVRYKRSSGETKQIFCIIRILASLCCSVLRSRYRSALLCLIVVFLSVLCAVIVVHSYAWLLWFSPFLFVACVQYARNEETKDIILLFANRLISSVGAYSIIAICSCQVRKGLDMET